MSVKKVLEASVQFTTLVLMAASAVFSYLSWKEQHYITETKKADIRVRVDAPRKDQRVEFRHGGGYVPNSILTSWNIEISNGSDKAVPITGFDVHELAFFELGGEFKAVNFRFIDHFAGLVDAETGQSALPLRLDAGQTKRLILNLRLAISPLAREKLSYELRYRPELTIRDAEDILLRHNTDLFGDRVTLIGKNRNFEYLAWFPNKGIITVKFLTADGQGFEQRGQWERNDPI